jgi:membrane associated rhomboid family serine protease
MKRLKRFGKLFFLGFISYSMISYLIDRIGGLTVVIDSKTTWTAAIFSFIFSLVMVQFFDDEKES